MAAITYHTVLNEAECRGTRNRVWELRERWIERGEHDPADFFTLGVATYLDVLGSNDPERNYYQRLPEYNQLLRMQFGDLLDRILGLFGQLLQGHVSLAEHLAVPGFHVFLGQAISRAATAPAHFDMQYESLRWTGPRNDDLPFSFTLPIAIPPSGAGLTTWPLSDSNIERRDLGDGACPLYNEADATLHYPYVCGTLVIQRGHILHRIAPASDIRLNDERITMQGHGLRCDGGWILYW